MLRRDELCPRLGRRFALLSVMARHRDNPFETDDLARSSPHRQRKVRGCGAVASMSCPSTDNDAAAAIAGGFGGPPISRSAGQNHRSRRSSTAR